MYRNLRMSIYTGCADLLEAQQPALSEYEPDWLRPARELKRVQDLGTRVDHQQGEGKDRSDARASAIWWAGQYEGYDCGGGGVDSIRPDGVHVLAGPEVVDSKTNEDGTPKSINQQAMEQVLWQTVRKHEREAARW